MQLCAQMLDSTESDSAACYNSVLTDNLLLKNRIKPKLWDLVCTVPQKADNKCDVTVTWKRMTTTQVDSLLLYFCN